MATTTNTYNVTMKNISIHGLNNGKIAEGETKTVQVNAESSDAALRIAMKQNFDGLGFHSQGRYGSDGTLIGEAVKGGSVYGRLCVYTELAA